MIEGKILLNKIIENIKSALLNSNGSNIKTVKNRNIKESAP